MPVSDIKELRILPPLAIGRLGSSPEPMDNYEATVPAGATSYRSLAPAETLRVQDGRIAAAETPAAVTFRDGAGRVRPVCPFLEVWARFEDDGPLEPLTREHLTDLGLGPSDIRWRVAVGNLKAYRRTGDDDDKIQADTQTFSDHDEKPLTGQCPHFKTGKTLPLGVVQYIEPTDNFPEIRLRFTPAAGKVYGPNAADPNLADDVYDAARGGWDNHADGDAGTPPSTVPGGIYRGQTNAQTRRKVSDGYLDDACDGVVDVELTIAAPGGAKTLNSFARISAGPPDFAPDSFHVRTVQDELEQMALGPQVNGPVTAVETQDVMRRALETVRLMQTQAMNGNQGIGGVPVNGNNMSGHDTGYQRAFEPIFPDAISEPTTVRDFHENALQILLSGTPPWFLDLLRKYDEVGDLTNAGRRTMPGMMRGSDGMHLALTRRQIDKVRAAAAAPVGGGASPEDEMKTLIAHFQSRASLHAGIDAGGGRTLNELFADADELLQYLKTGTAKGALAGSVSGQSLVVPGDASASALVTLLRRPGHPMQLPFSLQVPGTQRTGLEIVERWINSL